MRDFQISSKFEDQLKAGRNGLYFPDADIFRPTWDHAFKAIFLNHQELTLRFVNAFFDFESPITDLSFLSTEIEPQGHDAKSVRLDVALRLGNGTLIDLEMQTSLKAGYLRRSVLYAALLLVTHTKKGASHAKRHSQEKNPGKPGLESSSHGHVAQPNVISLTLLNDLLPHKNQDKFRHSYQLRDGDDFLDKDCFRIDVIELPRLRQTLDTLPASQRIWMRLFLAQSYSEVRQLAREEPLFSKVCEVLEMVSKNRKMQDRARMIWEGEFAVLNEKYILEKERLDEKIRFEREMAEARAKFESEAAEARAKLECERAQLENEAAEAKAKLECERAQLESEAAEAKAKLECERAQLESEAAEARAKLESEAAEARAMLESEAEQSVAKVQLEVNAKLADSERALSGAIRSLYAAGQTAEAIAVLMNLSTDRVIELLKTQS